MDFTTWPIPYLADQVRAYFGERKRPSSMILYCLLIGNRDAAQANTGQHAGTKMSKDRYMLPIESLGAVMDWLRDNAPADAWGSEAAVKRHLKPRKKR